MTFHLSILASYNIQYIGAQNRFLPTQICQLRMEAFQASFGTFNSILFLLVTCNGSARLARRITAGHQVNPGLCSQAGFEESNSVIEQPWRILRILKILLAIKEVLYHYSSYCS